MKEHNEKALSYKCDEKYGIGHWRTMQNWYLLNVYVLEESTDKEEEVIIENVANEPHNTEDELPKYFYNYLLLNSSPLLIKY